MHNITGVLIPISQFLLYMATLAQISGVPLPYHLTKSDDWSTSLDEIHAAPCKARRYTAPTPSPAPSSSSTRTSPPARSSTSARWRASSVYAKSTPSSSSPTRSTRRARTAQTRTASDPSSKS
ncbi:hypothetical protein BD309DRAFT_1069821 [Dichomitus squalens]|uniref:Uncharacterized protein n=1 Tax=Dichomitus squalens TaxID=114155 RepID=A0A4Q9N8J2_9APHY|nr:hypothetical protein BD311DRAFT_838759 [Dichomitus squalens]TBU36595.1 hypothetical protein BD309DRAFT_1069821 [Dichomitus squalens]